MRWRDRRESDNIEDRRGFGGKGIAIGGGLGGIIILVIALLLGADPQQLLEQLPQNNPGGSSAPTARQTNPEEEELKQFVGVVLAETEDVWTTIFQQLGREYRKPVLVLFRDGANSACGQAGASVGPFYCPADEKLYIDLSFFRELKTRFRAPGDFAIAYVVAHEVGHHIQNLLGTMGRVSNAQRQSSQEAGNALSVRLELQADCYSGVWARQAEKRGIVEPGDLDEALGAASAVGDDRLQRESQGYVVPDSFTHGSSQERSSWFRRGFDTGDIRQCETFR
jgi:predicted metalloprotease